MTAKKKAQTQRRRKPLAEPTPAQGNLAQLISGVLNDPDTPVDVINGLHVGLDRLHEEIKDADRLTDTPEYIALLLAEHKAQEGDAE
jgi:hypothetical protein